MEPPVGLDLASVAIKMAAAPPKIVLLQALWVRHCLVNGNLIVGMLVSHIGAKSDVSGAVMTKASRSMIKLKCFNVWEYNHLWLLMHLCIEAICPLSEHLSLWDYFVTRLCIQSWAVCTPTCHRHRSPISSAWLWCTQDYSPGFILLLCTPLPGNLIQTVTEHPERGVISVSMVWQLWMGLSMLKRCLLQNLLSKLVLRTTFLCLQVEVCDVRNQPRYASDIVSGSVHTNKRWPYVSVLYFTCHLNFQYQTVQIWWVIPYWAKAQEHKPGQQYEESSKAI